MALSGSVVCQSDISGSWGWWQLLSVLCESLGCSQEALVGVQEADIWCCSALRRPAGCIYCCPEHLPHAGLGWAGLELCRAEDVPSPSVYIQAVRVSGTEKGVPRSYLQT